MTIAEVGQGSQGPPIEDDEEDYDEEEQPLSEDIEDEEDVDEGAGPSAAAGSRAGETLKVCPALTCVSPIAKVFWQAVVGMAGLCAEIAEARLAFVSSSVNKVGYDMY